MIEVIKHGTKSEKTKSKKLVTRCNECGCVFSFTDCCPNNNGDLMHDGILCEDYILCAECGNRITVHDTSFGADSERFLCEII